MTLRVAFAAPPGAEGDAAWAWLAGWPEFTARRCASADLAAATEADVLWLHGASPVEDADSAALAAAVHAGKRLLLTLRATALLLPMGIERVRPNDVVESEWRRAEDPFRTADFQAMAAYPHIRGLAAWGPHPLFHELHGGTYTWAPLEGERFTRCCYRRGARPGGGRIIAVERAYIAQNPGRAVAWEYTHGMGRVLCIGAFVYFSAADRLLRPQLERLVRNALVDGPGPRSWWPEPATAAVPAEGLALPEPWDLDGALPDPSADPIALQGSADADAPFDLAGRRCLIVGSEQQGLREIWTHPHCLVEGWEVTADGELLQGTHSVVSPDAIVRTLESTSRRITEHLFAALEHPVAVLEYHAARKGRESVSRRTPLLAIEFNVVLRRMWPYAAGCGGNLRYRCSADGRALRVESESGDGVAAVLFGIPCDISVRARYERDVPVVTVRAAVELSVPLRIAVVGGADPTEFERTWRAVERLGASGLVRQRLQRAVTIREARLKLSCDDERVRTSLEWAKRRLDAFVADVPGVGRSLVAGYAGSRAGWGESRPGYAWFFGRDACWTAFAHLAMGEHSVPRQVLRFLGDTQDVTGKVIHEVTTSGQYHYDAADSTPLYLLLAGRYLQWSGDVAFITSIWPRLERALNFCITTDTDGDGLIENSRVGHGWIESGLLGGAHVSLYMAAVWRAALEAAARAADAVGESRTAADCWARAARAGQAIEAEFWGEALGGYALDKRADGSRTWARTALQSVAILLGAANPVRSRGYLDALAGPEFSAEWGVRMLPVSDPHFNPDAYHGGTVWPLYTGWASLAEYRAGRPDAGFVHFRTNTSLAFARQRGAFDEVLHGGIERSAGVCPDQAWSAAMVVLPLVEGLLGAEPDAPGSNLTLAPCLPRSWDWMEVTGLRCGETVLDVRLRRRGDALAVRLRRTGGRPLWVTLAPLLDSVPSRVEVDGQVVKPRAVTTGGSVRHAVSFEASGEHDVTWS